MFHERLPDPRRELGTLIRHYVLRHPVVPEDVCKQGFRSLYGRKETGQREETTGLRGIIHNDQDRYPVRDEDQSENPPTGATKAAVERIRGVTYLGAGA